MEYRSRSSTALISGVICLTLAITTPMPISEGNYNIDLVSSLYFDACKLCLTVSDNDACEHCLSTIIPVKSMVGKRGGVYYPLLRGGYPKRAYRPFYNPLNRGGYLKKSYSPSANVYHPFLRGGYRGPILPQSYWNTDDEDDEP